MRQLDKLDLIDRIGRELQSRMTFSDIDAYLSGFGVPGGRTASSNSKWVYVKDGLAGAPDETVIRIANELELAHPFVVTPNRVVESPFWRVGHFRLFLSHLSSFKVTTHALQKVLEQYGISAFVAHVDIEPTREWQSEIENALFSMDALAALLTTGFADSKWTDQEIGVALGRGMLVIPVIKDLDPYGLMGKFQGINARHSKVGAVAREIFDALISSDQTRAKAFSALISATLLSATDDEAMGKLQIWESLDKTPRSSLERLREGAAQSQGFKNPGPQTRLDALLKRHGLDPVSSAAPSPWDQEDDLPF